MTSHCAGAGSLLQLAECLRRGVLGVNPVLAADAQSQQAQTAQGL
jgi:hypothetical protein